MAKAKEHCWRYSDEGPKLFEPGQEIPAGYVDTPAKLKKAKAKAKDADEKPEPKPRKRKKTLFKK